MLIFKNGSTRSIRRLKQLLIVYEKAPGQKINFEKSGSFHKDTRQTTPQIGKEKWVHSSETPFYVPGSAIV